MKLNRGFTLAEVLVALAIVGILAAVTLPAIQASLKKSAVGPSLMKVIGNLENANRLLLQEKDTDSLTSLCKDDYLGCISKKASLSKVYNLGDATAPSFAENYDGTNTKKYNYKSPVYVSDDGVTFMYYQYDSFHAINNGLPDLLKDKYEGNYYLILVDTNGIKGSPNVVGKDIFSFVVDGYGTVIAHGSREYINYNGNNNNKDNYWANSDKCANGTKPTSNNGRLCCGSIIDNGGKVLYKY